MNTKYYKNKCEIITCAFCGIEFNPQGTHLRIHNIKNKEYYDLYLKDNQNEGNCLVCGNPTKFLTLKNGYAKYCSRKCCAISEETKQNKIKTCLKLYGVEYINQNKEIQEKSKHTRFVKNNGNYESDSSTEKRKETNLNKYGYEYGLQSDIIKTKSRETCLNNYGYEYYLQTDECKIKTKNKCLEENSCEFYTQTKKCREELKNYYDNQLYKEKREQANEKRKETCLNLYNTEYSFQSDNNKQKTKETLTNKYGSVENSYKIRTNKAEKTNIERYGCKSPAQSPDIDCSCHRIQYDGHNFDSNWEYLYYKYLKEHNIDFVYKPKITLEFEYDGQIRYYKPDFKVNGVLTEIKGDQFFKDGKMICPWKHKDDTLEQIEWRNGLFEAKHQCMLNNGVNILKQKELKELGVL